MKTKVVAGFEGYDQLSAAEKEAFYQLQFVSPESLLGLAVKNVVRDPDVMRFRRLVCDLKSQAVDSPEIMVSILGKESYDSIIINL